MSAEADAASGDSEDEVEQFDDGMGIDDVEEDVADAAEAADEDDGTESDSEESDTSADEEEEDEDESSSQDVQEDEEDDDIIEANRVVSNGTGTTMRVRKESATTERVLNPSAPRRADSPTHIRRLQFHAEIRYPKSYSVDAICALPHPVPTHALASSLCMSHLLTGSEDGYIRDYDIFSACNGKTFLTAPQRQHCGFVEGVIKAGVLRAWWESSSLPPQAPDIIVEPTRPPVYGLLVHSDALWGLAGLKSGSINLFTVRHEPGRIIHTLTGHNKPIAGLAMSPDEKAFYSAGWDGEVLLWDLNTGVPSRRYPDHASHASAIPVSSIALRPLFLPSVGHLVSFGASLASPNAVPVEEKSVENTYSLPSITQEITSIAPSVDPVEHTAGETGEVVAMDVTETTMDTKSDGSYDPLFDDDPQVEAVNSEAGIPNYVWKDEEANLALPGTVSPLKNLRTPQIENSSQMKTSVPFTHSISPFDESLASRFSHDLFFTAYFNGQILIWDKRAQSADGEVGRLEMGDKTPPWCLSVSAISNLSCNSIKYRKACWSADGAQIYAGRRNGTIDVWDVRKLGTHTRDMPRILRTLRNPLGSGEVSCLAAFPDGKHLICASHDNIRLWNVAEPEDARSRAAQFKIVTGHHGAQISQMLVDPSARFMISASGNRGWFGFGESSRTVLVHEIKEAS